jgi:tetratricopeptide (TPR) repeat protein
MMGFLKLLSGKSPEEKGDEFFEAGEYGAAKLQYEKALDKLTNKSTGKSEDIKRLKEKVVRSKEALAHSHVETAEDLMETGYWDEAEERLRLASDLTEDEGLRGEIEKMLEEIQEQISDAGRREFSDVYLEGKDLQKSEADSEGEEYFLALCGTLSDEERRAYYRYGDAFRRGFVALNRGDFEAAVSGLTQALEENGEPGSFIPLELATAYLNVGNQVKAYSLLEGFLEEHPESLRAYQVMCEVLWERKAFDQALELLDSCREGLDEPIVLVLLRSETLFQAGRYQEVESFLQDALNSLGWEENIARSLARTYEAKGEKEKARNLYGKIMTDCQSCRHTIDPYVKKKYADISFDLKQYSTDILEIYLSLAREDPQNRSGYYLKVSQLYSLMGNETESRRFRAFAQEFKD